MGSLIWQHYEEATKSPVLQHQMPVLRSQRIPSQRETSRIQVIQGCVETTSDPFHIHLLSTMQFLGWLQRRKARSQIVRDCAWTSVDPIEGGQIRTTTSQANLNHESAEETPSGPNCAAAAEIQGKHNQTSTRKVRCAQCQRGKVRSQAMRNCEWTSPIPKYRHRTATRQSLYV